MSFQLKKLAQATSLGMLTALSGCNLLGGSEDNTPEPAPFQTPANDGNLAPLSTDLKNISLKKPQWIDGKLYMTTTGGIAIYNPDTNKVIKATTTYNPTDFGLIRLNNADHIVTTETDYSASAMSLFALTTPDSVTTPLNAGTTTDIAVDTYGDSAYVLGRYGFNTLTKYQGADLSKVYQCSVNGADDDANPYQTLFISDTKAYLIRYLSLIHI